MVLASLVNFPDVCRLCLQPRPAPEMIPTDSTQPEFAAQLVDLLEDFCFSAPQDLCDALPSVVCEKCQQEFLVAYKLKRRLEFLLHFQFAFVRSRQGEEEPLRLFFEEHHEYLTVLFQELGLIDQNSLVWEDLVEEDGFEKLVKEEHVIDKIVCNENEPQTFDVELLEMAEAETLSEHIDAMQIEYLDEDVDTEDKQMFGQQKSSPRLKSEREEPVTSDNHNSKTHHRTKRHEQQEQSEWICEVDDCQLHFSSKELFVRHRKEVHQCCVCDICGIVLKNKYSLETHVRRHKGETQFPCEYCQSSFHTTQEQKLHLALVHLATESVECEVCGLEFKTVISLKRHLKSHSEARQYPCPYCEKAFKTTNHLHRHKETIHMKVRYNCDHCDVSYGRKDKLRMHVERAHDIQTYFLCDICLKSFPTDQQLQEHMGHHANPKPLECARCLVAFLSQDDFGKHLCISYQEDYVCCERDFKFHTFYNKHMFLVHGEKTNVRVKPLANKLIAHLRAERKYEERCSKCEKAFATRKLKIVHQKVCLGIKEEGFSKSTLACNSE